VSDLTAIKPAIPASDWHANAADALKRTADMLAAIPDSHPLIAWGGVALGAVLFLQRVLPIVGPFIPVVGPYLAAAKPLQPLLDLVWKYGSHADAVSADQAKAVLASSAGDLLPLAQTANARPEVIAALKALAGA
jgi:hypothetical protein